MSEWLDRELRELVAHAHEHTPAMRARMAAAEISPADIQTAADLALLPVLQKDDLVRLQAENPPFGGMLAMAEGDLPRIYISPGPYF